MYRDSCGICNGTGREHKNCPKCEGEGEFITKREANITKECPSRNCVNGKFSPNCKNCEGKGCEKCHNTGQVLWDPERGKSKKPETGTHVKGETHFWVTCKICEGANRVTRKENIPVRNKCPECQGYKTVPTGEDEFCTNCGGTGNKKLGNQIEIPQL